MSDSENTEAFREQIPILEKVKLCTGEISVEIYRKTLNFLIDSIDQTLDGVIGLRSSRIGCFGSYENGYLKIIKSIMLYVTGRDLSAITGRCCVKPGTEVFIPMDDIYSTAYKSLKEDMREADFYKNFVRLVSKAIICLNIPGAQFDEANGCDFYDIPALGFIIHKKISDENSCMYLMTESCFSECTVPNKMHCYLQYDKDKFCPFYRSVRITLSVREFFMRDGYRLIAITRLEDLFPLINEFLDIS